MKKIIHKHKDIWNDKRFILSVLLGLLMLGASFVINFYCGAFANANMSNSVADILLSNIPVLSFKFVLIDGVPIFIGLLFLLSVLEPKRIPFIMKSMALFVIIRAVFITMTHIAPFPDRELFNLSAISGNLFVAGFFSGHTGMPFLMALAFWKNKLIRNIFLFFTVVAAVSVILSHVHYSIDVFAAPFITYSIFIIAQKFFTHDYKMFTETMNSSPSKK